MTIIRIPTSIPSGYLIIPMTRGAALICFCNNMGGLRLTNSVSRKNERIVKYPKHIPFGIFTSIFCDFDGYGSAVLYLF